MTSPVSVTKSEFAELIGLSAGRISQLIREGKIKSTSLDGTGRSARVLVERAKADLRGSLDPSQSLGLNGIRTRAGLAAGSPEAQTPSGAGPTLMPQDPSALVAQEIAQEKLRQARMVTARMERDDALSVGRFMLADEARAKIGSAASSVLVAVEAGLPDMADAIAAEYGLTSRDILHTLMKAFRSIRETASRSFAEKEAERKAALADAEEERRSRETEADEAETEHGEE